ncbi:DoxX family protein [Burkholderia territorii]|uniref:DoxX family protein n=1 Tax=Burkholderia territorii TaxID=1503055 RepID=UPI0007B9FAC8|nr:DoxX family protein [Burkholderia territorii]
MKIQNLSTGLRNLLELIGVALQPIAACIVRLYLYLVFFLSGIVKLCDWDGGLYQFSDAHHLLTLPPAIVAAMEAGTELIFSILLVLGWQGRFAAAGLFVVNIMTILSYPSSDMLMVQDHVLWAVLLGYLFIYGAGSWSLDSWLIRRTRVSDFLKAMNKHANNGRKN